jgi:hypothetical protein
MLTKMEESAPAVPKEHIDQLESEMGVVLPAAYKQFLLEHNGGRPTPNAFPIEGMENNPFGVIQVFFGLGDEIESCDLRWNREVFRDRLPPNLFPIACDDGSDLICLSLRGRDGGAILFWDGQAEGSPPSCCNVYRIAASFSEFINGLTDLPES